jgi:hypothetical protein
MDPVSCPPLVANMKAKKLKVEIVTVTDIKLSTRENLGLLSSRQISFYCKGAKKPLYTETYTIRYAALLLIMAIIYLLI